MFFTATTILSLSSLLALTKAYTQPTTATWGPLLTPDTSSPVTQGTTYTVTWDPQSHATDGVTVSLVLCHGPGNNCVNSPSAIVEGVPAAQKSYSWDVPCSLSAGTAGGSDGYGMLIIVDGTGEFQYSTQFSVLASPACGNSASGSSSSSGTTSAPVSSPTGNSTSSTSLLHVGGYTTAPGQGGYSNSSTSTAATISAPSSIVTATGSAAGISGVASATGGDSSTSYAVASPSLASASASGTFSGAAVPGVKLEGGLVVGILGLLGAMLA